MKEWMILKIKKFLHEICLAGKAFRELVRKKVSVNPEKLVDLFRIRKHCIYHLCMMLFLQKTITKSFF